MPGGHRHHQGNPTRPPISKVSKDFLAGAGKRKGNKGRQPVRYVKVALRKDNHTIITRLKCLRRTRLAHLVSLYLRQKLGHGQWPKRLSKYMSFADVEDCINRLKPSLNLDASRDPYGIVCYPKAPSSDASTHSPDGAQKKGDL